MEMVPMKLPSGDESLSEDEIEGLVSASIDSNGFGSQANSVKVESRRSQRSRAWVSSSKVGKRKKCLVFLAIIVISGLLVSLTVSDENGIKETIKSATGFGSADDDANEPSYGVYGSGSKNSGGKGVNKGKENDDGGGGKSSDIPSIDEGEAKENPDALSDDEEETGDAEGEAEANSDNTSDNEEKTGDAEGEAEGEAEENPDTPSDDEEKTENDEGEAEENSDTPSSDAEETGDTEGEAEENSNTPSDDEEKTGDAEGDAEENPDTPSDDEEETENVEGEGGETSDPGPNGQEEADGSEVQKSNENETEGGGDGAEGDDNDENEDEEAKKQAMIEKWGKWHFWDGDPDSRPTGDFLAKYPNRDCPFEEFPDEAWQADAVYVNHMLDSAAELVDRAKEAIYTEYGYGPLDEITHEQRIERRKMFRLELVDFNDPNVREPADSHEQGGWTTRKSFEGLARRLLHAMMTNDTFTVVLGGHSAAAGHGNLFLQSYMMQFHQVLEPIFDRVGVKLISRNLARGGLGTLQDSLGSGSIYGDEVDMILWDSSMTENYYGATDIFYRQALIGGKRAPVLMAWHKQFDVLKNLHLNADADILCPGNAMYGIPETLDSEQAETLPYAARYMKCGLNNKNQCTDNANKFRANCWIDRDDVTPPVRQQNVPESQVSWHPGFRAHQLNGRALAMVVLDALQDAIDTWLEITIVQGNPLPDEYWHMSDIYDNIQSKAKNLDPSWCNEDIKGKNMPERVCSTPMKGRTEFTPRANPQETSLVSLLKPTPDGFIPENKAKMLYDGPDVPNPMLMPGEGEVDVRAIVSNRRKLSTFDPFTLTHLNNRFLKQYQHSNISSSEISMEKHNSLRRRQLDEIKAGKGWMVDAYPGNCDGTSTGYCGRLPSSTCLLSGHSDYRGGILGDALSGWLKMEIPKVEFGLIMVKFESWHLKKESHGTEGWTEVNDGEYDRRDLKESALPLPNNFFFEYAINGEVTSLNLEQYKEAVSIPQRVVEVITILDDPVMETKENVEVAFRLRNCRRECVFKFTHLYWA